jgi:hypothetical protein
MHFLDFHPPYEIIATGRFVVNDPNLAGAFARYSAMSPRFDLAQEKRSIRKVL